MLFEKVSREVSDRVPQAQSLLEPAAVELSPGQEELVQASMALMERYGFVLEPFGERTYLLRAIPSVVKDTTPGKALLEVLDLMAFEGPAERAGRGAGRLHRLPQRRTRWHGPRSARNG